MGSLLKTLNLGLLYLIGLLGVLALCLWLILRPKVSSCTIVNFSVPPLPNKGNQTRALEYTIEITNQNTDSKIYYDDILLTCRYEQDTLANSRIPASDLGKGKQYRIINHADIHVNVVRSLVPKMANATAQVKMDLMTTVMYSTWGIKSKHRQVHLQGNIPIGADGKMPKKKKAKLHAPEKQKHDVQVF